MTRARDALMRRDRDSVLRWRDGLRGVVDFQDRRADLFPPAAPDGPRTLRRTQKEEVWGAWQRALDYLLALDSLRASYGAADRLSGAERGEAFSLRYGAFLAQYRWSMEFIERAERDPGLDAVLDDAVPELGLPKGSYARLKYRWLHVGRAAEFAAMEALHRLDRPRRPSALCAAIEDDAAAVWRAGGGRGELMTARNALKVVRDAGKRAWLPVQSGVAEWMGDVRVRRDGASLISAAQVRELVVELEPGDVMVQRREWFLSNIGIPGWWTHAALVMGTPEERRRRFGDEETRAWVRAQGRADGDFEGLLRARHPAAYRKSLVPDGGHAPRVVEAIGEGVSFTSMEHSAFADSLAALRPRLSRKARAQALLRAFGYAGRPYDYEFDFATDSALVCSELVYKSYEAAPGKSGLSFPLVEVMGRRLSPPNEFVRGFDADLGTPRQQFDLAVFLDGYEGRRAAVRSDLRRFRASWKRPKWHLLSTV